jgi:hypothetical protein
LALLELEHVTRRFGGVVALDDVSFSKRYDRSGNVKDFYNLYGSLPRSRSSTRSSTRGGTQRGRRSCALPRT